MNNPQTENDNIIRSVKPGFEYPNVSVAEFIAQKVATHDPSTPAIVNPVDDSEVNYGDFHRQAQQFASSLLSFGAAQGDLVLFFAENSAQYAIALIGTVYLGLPICPIPPTSGSFELVNHINDASGAVLVFGSDKTETLFKACNDPNYAKTMKQLKVLVQLGTKEHSLFEHEIFKSKTVIKSFDSIFTETTCLLTSIPYFKPDDLKKSPFCLCFTSGSTGKPKAAIHSNQSFVAMLLNMQIGQSDKKEYFLHWHPLGHMSGTFLLLFNIRNGNSIVFHQSGQLELLLASVEKYKLFAMHISSSHASQMLTQDYPSQFDLSSLSLIVHAGSKVAPNFVKELMEKYGVICFDAYASTECMAAVGDRKFPDWIANFECGNLGTVHPNVEMKIADLTDGKTALPRREHGEICFRSEAVFVGYLNNEEATKATIDEDGWYHSGDVGYVNEAGDLFFVDRIKEMIKYQLYSIVPAEIEEFLYGQEGVKGVCVVGVPDAIDGELVRAYVQLKKGSQVTEKELIDAVAENMGKQKQLRGGVHFVPTMPRTMIGKINRQYFKNLAKQSV